MINRTGFILLLLTCIVQISAAQTAHSVAFYNVENLFDTLDTPGKDDAEFLPESARQWNSQKYYEKLAHINQVFVELGQPVIFGMCEIENFAVVQDVVNTDQMKGNYAIVHFESQDNRGIDNALLYDTRQFKLEDSGIIRFAMPDNSGPSRDIVWAKLEHGNDMYLVMVNHWPSRSGGQVETEPKRLIAANAARHFVDSVMLASPRIKLIFMGDLNDYPENIAPQMVSKVLTPMITPKSGVYGGTHNYKGEWDIFDHIMVSPNCLKKSGGYVLKKSGKIHSPEFLLELYKEQLVPFRTYGGTRYLGGYSDHLPVSIQLVL